VCQASRARRVESVSSRAVRQARHSQNAWARHVKRVKSCRVVLRRDEPSGIRAYVCCPSGSSYKLPWRVKSGGIDPSDHPRVVFISSKVPATEVHQTHVHSTE